MSGLFQLFRSRVGVAIVGAILVGGLGAVFGIGSIWHPILPIAGGIVQGDATATTATTAAQATVTPEVTATPAATATTIPTVGPIATATPFPVGSTIHGSVVSIGANSFVISRNGVHYTILVDGATTYTGDRHTVFGIRAFGWLSRDSHSSRSRTGQQHTWQRKYRIAT